MCVYIVSSVVVHCFCMYVVMIAVVVGGWCCVDVGVGVGDVVGCEIVV